MQERLILIDRRKSFREVERDQMIFTLLAQASQSITLDGSWISPVIMAVAVALLWWRMGKSEDKLDEIDKTVRSHDSTDRELTAKVDGQEKRADRFESYVMNEFADIKASQRKTEDKLDHILEKV